MKKHSKNYDFLKRSDYPKNLNLNWLELSDDSYERQSFIYESLENLVDPEENDDDDDDDDNNKNRIIENQKEINNKNNKHVSPPPTKL